MQAKIRLLDVTVMIVVKYGSKAFALKKRMRIF